MTQRAKKPGRWHSLSPIFCFVLFLIMFTSRRARPTSRDRTKRFFVISYCSFHNCIISSFLSDAFQYKSSCTNVHVNWQFVPRSNLYQQVGPESQIALISFQLVESRVEEWKRQHTQIFFSAVLSEFFSQQNTGTISCQNKLTHDLLKESGLLFDR